ncbi:hypothetical protein IJT10_05415, partial [bacterium]|nr:hypothetical protein [bacterium]
MYNKVDGRLMQAGDRFEFGRCPQGPNGEVEPITWRVLHRYSDSLLVIAEYGLCNKRYNDKFYNESKCITWSNCTLRRWLNNDFMKKVFNAQEQSLIKISNLTNNAGPSTQDQVFLLSEDEARILFTDDDDRVMNLTKYAHKKCGLCGV